MSDGNIGSDGLTDEERAWREYCGDTRSRAASVGASIAHKVLVRLAAERLTHAAEKAAHAETRTRAEGLERQLIAITDRLRDDTATLTARAEKAEAERDRLRAALAYVAERAEQLHATIDAMRSRAWERRGYGYIIEMADAALERPAAPVIAARALLGEVKP